MMENLDNMLQIESILLKNGQDIELLPVSSNERYLLDMHAYSTIEKFYEFLEFDAFLSLDETRIYLNSLIDRSKSGEGQYWFIFLPQEAVVVGTIGLHSLDANRLSAEVGYGLSPHYQGRGIFTKALKIILSYGFDVLGLTRIVAKTDVNNAGSIKGLVRNGFMQEGVMRKYYRYVNEQRYSDCVFLSKLFSEHEAEKP
ncbi:GNAT family N-acetyltransferase [Pseudomonadales bacterium]|nr:GNAT family N-acetyltransferase [Pseudomonadales bacterium]